jgi:hypothetical protein
LAQLEGDGVWDRTETFQFHATDDITGFESWTASSDKSNQSISTFNLPNIDADVVGTDYQNLSSGVIRIQLWEALPKTTPSGPIYMRTDSIISGQESSLTIPYDGAQHQTPAACNRIFLEKLILIGAVPTVTSTDVSHNGHEIVFPIAYMLLTILAFCIEI